MAMCAGVFSDVRGYGAAILIAKTFRMAVEKKLNFSRRKKPGKC